jgi:plasmid stabilization system protein ParE
MLTDAQQRLRDALEALADIDDELDEIDAREDAWNQARREMQKRRIAITNDLKLAHAAAGRPREAVHVGHRLIVFDSGFCLVTSYRVLTPSAFALMACPDEDHPPPVEGTGGKPPMGVLVPAPDRQGV